MKSVLCDRTPSAETTKDVTDVTVPHDGANPSQASPGIPDGIITEAEPRPENVASSSIQRPSLSVPPPCTKHPVTDPVPIPGVSSDAMENSLIHIAKPPEAAEPVPIGSSGMIPLVAPIAPPQSSLDVAYSDHPSRLGDTEGSKYLESSRLPESLHESFMDPADNFSHLSGFPDEVQSPRRPLTTIPEDESIQDWEISEPDCAEYDVIEFPDPDPDLGYLDDNYEDWSGVGAD